MYYCIWIAEKLPSLSVYNTLGKPPIFLKPSTVPRNTSSGFLVLIGITTQYLENISIINSPILNSKSGSVKITDPFETLRMGHELQNYYILAFCQSSQHCFQNNV